MHLCIVISIPVARNCGSNKDLKKCNWKIELSLKNKSLSEKQVCLIMKKTYQEILLLVFRKTSAEICHINVKRWINKKNYVQHLGIPKLLLWIFIAIDNFSDIEYIDKEYIDIEYVDIEYIAM